MGCRVAGAVLLAGSVAVTSWGKEPLLNPPSETRLAEVDAYLLEKVYRSADAEASLALVQNDPAWDALIQKHDIRLLGGPMIGQVTPGAAAVWVRTPKAAKVEWVLQGAGRKHVTKTVRTSADGDFAAVLHVDGLKPFTRYHYTLRVNGESVFADGEWPSFRTAPEAGSKEQFSIGFGGCSRYVPKNEGIWRTIANEQPQAFLFLGDNIYIDEPSWRGRQRAMYYRRQFRPDYQALTSGTAMAAIWDDHDFGKNDCAGGPLPFEPAWKPKAWEVFRENWINPAYGGGSERPGCWFDFSVGDVDVFMTDGRYYRDFKAGTMLGPDQKAWLKKRLKASTATFKVIGSGTLFTKHADKGDKDSWWGVKEEREELFSFIEAEGINGVVLVTASRLLILRRGLIDLSIQIAHG